ncbi:MAG: class I SAM-dependent methyltransferase [Burkholderiales bacterium]|nr:class I SAM-dependent methyltransferase [Burkholderiales bacterium]
MADRAGTWQPERARVSTMIPTHPGFRVLPGAAAADRSGIAAGAAAVAMLWFAAACAPAWAQFPDITLKPPYVPTPQVTVDEMLRLAEVTDRDVVMDLGSGDGRLAITAAVKFGARGIGIELDDTLLIQSEENARQAGVADRVTFLEQDLFRADLSRATVITMYLLPAVNMKLRPALLALRPGTRIVSHDFDLGDWRADRRTTIRKNTFLWIVPAKVAGRWRARLPLPPIERLLELDLVQRYQELSATARLNGVPAQVWEAKLSGERLSFVVVDTTDRDNHTSLYFTGRVTGDAIEGEVTRGVGATRATVRFSARRLGS